MAKISRVSFKSIIAGKLCCCDCFFSFCWRKTHFTVGTSLLVELLSRCEELDRGGACDVRQERQVRRSTLHGARGLFPRLQSCLHPSHLKRQVLQQRDFLLCLCFDSDKFEIFPTLRGLISLQNPASRFRLRQNKKFIRWSCVHPYERVGTQTTCFRTHCVGCQSI